MDLGAYTQIDKLEELAANNGIEVPRLRGYRLMSEEKPLPQENIAEMYHSAEMKAADDFCEAEPAFSMDPFAYELSSKTDRVKEKYLIRKTENWKYGPHRETVGIRWERIHGKRRKVLKYMIKKARQAIKKSADAWNKYAGKENVLYIHARIGGDNWLCFGGADLEKQPWFLERVDDFWDCTYCDIYARIIHKCLYPGYERQNNMRAEVEAMEVRDD